HRQPRHQSVGSYPHQLAHRSWLRDRHAAVIEPVRPSALRATHAWARAIARALPATATLPNQTTRDCSWGYLLGSQLSHKRLEDVGRGRAAGDKLRLQLAHEGHQLIHSCHDPPLFS